MLLTMVAAVSIASMMPMSWKAAGRSDYVGKATGLLQDELEWRQYQTMRGVDPTTLEYPEAGQVIVEGDTTFTVFTITSPVAGHPNTWTINVRVTWREILRVLSAACRQHGNLVLTILIRDGQGRTR